MGLVETATMITAAGHPPKQIAEYVGRLNSGSGAISIARMKSPGGWQEPGQTPEFDEYTLILKGAVRVETRTGVTNVTSGQLFIAAAGEWVRYTTPAEEGAEYIAICTPVSSPEAVNRDPASQR
ncbi:MAG TPA: cupin [Bryobacteraceae bacterium]|jgi:mannose-6-phosphate isomerase-like protein (cupin superfamily)